LRGKEEGTKLVVQEAKLKKTHVPQQSISVAPAAYSQSMWAKKDHFKIYRQQVRLHAYKHVSIHPCPWTLSIPHCVTL